MKIVNKFITFLSDNKKKCTIATALVLCIGSYFTTGKIMTDDTVNDDIPLHDGDVLVTSDEVSELENTDTYFQELRATLDMDRNKIISMLEDDEKTKLLNYMEQEKTIETLIKNKGLPECFVVITDNGVNITVNTEDLDQSTVTKICEIVMRQTDVKASEIVVQDVS